MQRLRFIASLGGIVVIAMTIFGQKAAFAAPCILTPLERSQLSGIQHLQAHPIWVDFPAKYHFAVREFEAETPGFFVVAPEERSEFVEQKFATGCDGSDSLVQSTEALTPRHKKYYPGCSSSTKGQACLEIPIFEKVFDHFKKPIGILGLELDKFKKIEQMFGVQTYNRAQLSIYHSLHEMFHDYQEENRWKTGGLPINLDICVESNPAWRRRYQREIGWWSRNLSAIHAASSNKDRLVSILKQFLTSIRPPDKVYPDCQRTLALRELHEGVAHFVGSLALLRAELADGPELARIDRAYFQVPYEVHNVMWVYGTGGGLSWLLYYLMGDEFIAKVNQSKTPFDIATEFLDDMK